MLMGMRKELLDFHLRKASLMLSGGHAIYRDISTGGIEGSLVMSIKYMMNKHQYSLVPSTKAELNMTEGYVNQFLTENSYT
tara:strand:- start:105 stop:347 length:243 start_codon:yes stop_codon:yes gene_type:complete